MSTQEFSNPKRPALRSMIWVAMIMPVQAVAAYLLLGFMYSFLVKQAGLDPRTALLSNAASIAVYATFMPVGGALSDRFGRKALLSVGAAWLAVAAVPAVWLAASGVLAGAVAGQVLIAIGIGLYGGACSVAAAELFPTASRATGHAVAYQVTVAVFGGTAPLVSGWLVAISGWSTAPGLYVAVIALINLLLVQFVPETKGVSLRTSVEGLALGRGSDVNLVPGQTPAWGNLETESKA